MYIGYIIFGIVALVSWLIQRSLKSKFEKYSKISIPRGMTGKDVAMKMLRDNGIFDVTVISTDGHLTDHYNPATKTVNLSENVYGSSSVAAAAIAAHECGHADLRAVTLHGLPVHRPRRERHPVLGDTLHPEAGQVLVGASLTDQ